MCFKLTGGDKVDNNVVTLTFWILRGGEFTPLVAAMKERKVHLSFKGIREQQ